MSDLDNIEAILSQVHGSPLAMANIARTLLLAKGHNAHAVTGSQVDAFGLEFYPSAEAFEATRGAVFHICADHDRVHLRVWCEGD